MRLIFLGPPGAGKGTQAGLLSERHGVAHLSSGDLLRHWAQREDAAGRQMNEMMQAGSLVPDSVVTGLVLSGVEELGKQHSFVLDGFPRTVEQARALDAKLREKFYSPIDLAVDFEIADSAVVERLTGRRVCERCGDNYHVTRLPPRRERLCDSCGGSLVRRADDQPETIQKRLSVYKEETLPLLRFYQGQGKLKKVPGDLQVDEQYQALVVLLKSEQLVS